MSETEEKQSWMDRVGKTFLPVLFFGMLSGALVLHVLSPARTARLVQIQAMTSFKVARVIILSRVIVRDLGKQKGTCF